MLRQTVSEEFSTLIVLMVYFDTKQSVSADFQPRIEGKNSKKLSEAKLEDGCTLRQKDIKLISFKIECQSVQFRIEI